MSTQALYDNANCLPECPHYGSEPDPHDPMCLPGVVCARHLQIIGKGGDGKPLRLRDCYMVEWAAEDEWPWYCLDCPALMADGETGEPYCCDGIKRALWADGGKPACAVIKPVMAALGELPAGLGEECLM